MGKTRRHLYKNHMFMASVVKVAIPPMVFILFPNPASISLTVDNVGGNASGKCVRANGHLASQPVPATCNLLASSGAAAPSLWGGFRTEKNAVSVW